MDTEYVWSFMLARGEAPLQLGHSQLVTNNRNFGLHTQVSQYVDYVRSFMLACGEAP